MVLSIESIADSTVLCAVLQVVASRTFLPQWALVRVTRTCCSWWGHSLRFGSPRKGPRRWQMCGIGCETTAGL